MLSEPVFNKADIFGNRTLNCRFIADKVGVFCNIVGRALDNRTVSRALEQTDIIIKIADGKCIFFRDSEMLREL